MPCIETHHSWSQPCWCALILTRTLILTQLTVWAILECWGMDKLLPLQDKIALLQCNKHFGGYDGGQTGWIAGPNCGRIFPHRQNIGMFYGNTWLEYQDRPVKSGKARKSWHLIISNSSELPLWNCFFIYWLNHFSSSIADRPVRKRWCVGVFGNSFCGNQRLTSIKDFRTWTERS